MLYFFPCSMEYLWTHREIYGRNQYCWFFNRHLDCFYGGDWWFGTWNFIGDILSWKQLIPSNYHYDRYLVYKKWIWSFLYKNGTFFPSYVLIPALSLFVALPLGLLRNIDSLSSVSTASVLFYLFLVLKVSTKIEARTEKLKLLMLLKYLNKQLHFLRFLAKGLDRYGLVNIWKEYISGNPEVCCSASQSFQWHYLAKRESINY